MMNKYFIKRAWIFIVSFFFFFFLPIFSEKTRTGGRHRRSYEAAGSPVRQQASSTSFLTNKRRQTTSACRILSLFACRRSTISGSWLWKRCGDGSRSGNRWHQKATWRCSSYCPQPTKDRSLRRRDPRRNRCTVTELVTKGKILLPFALIKFQSNAIH